MRFSVETWAPDYGTPTDGTEEETTATVDPEVELPASMSLDNSPKPPSWAAARFSCFE